MRIWPRKPGGTSIENNRGSSGTRAGSNLGWVPSNDRQNRYSKSGSLDNRYGSRTGLGPGHHLVPPLSGLHLQTGHCGAWHDVAPGSKLTINPKGELIKKYQPIEKSIYCIYYLTEQSS